MGKCISLAIGCNMVSVSEQVLKDMFERAYEAGWRGSLDLKDDFVASLMKEVAIYNETKVENFLGGEILIAGGAANLGTVTITGIPEQLLINPAYGV